MYWVTCIEGGPKRVNHAAAAVDDFIYSFGGYCTGEELDGIRPMDVHKLNTKTLRWYEVLAEASCNMDIPFQRYGHTVIAYEQKIYIWGGRNDEFACNYLFCFDTEFNRWSRPKVRGNIPPARDGHSACLSGSKMYIFGGYEEESESFSQEVYMLDLKEMYWGYISTLGTPPSFRDFHTAAVLNNRMYIFGGRGDRTYLSNYREEVYSCHIVYLNFDNYTWYKPSYFGHTPIGRRSHSAFVHDGCMYIFGGYNGNLRKHYNEIYQYNPRTSFWKLMEPFGTPPCERRRQSCVLVKDRMFLFGGTSPIEDIPREESLIMDEEAVELMDHSDLHVLDFSPSLLTLCMFYVLRYKLDTTGLPLSLQDEIEMFTERNNITDY